MPLSDFLQAPPVVDVVISATKSSEPLFDETALRRFAQQPLWIDLAIPRDVCPQAVRAVGAKLVDVDSLRNFAVRQHMGMSKDIANARIIIDEALHMLRKHEAERLAADGVCVVRAYFERALQSVDVSDTQKRLLLNKLTHGPVRALKDLAFEHGNEAVVSFLRGLE
jgi:glutamyl-tRNA reductase